MLKNATLFASSRWISVLFGFFNTTFIKTLSYYKNNKKYFALFLFKNMSRQEIKAAHNFWKPVLDLF